MTARKLACIILAAGKGARMKSATPKPLLKVAGREMVRHVLDAASGLSPDKVVVVAGPDFAGEMEQAVKPHAVAVQAAPDGTGGAVRAAAGALKGFDGDVLILYGDSPLITTETLKRMVEARRALPAVGLVYAGVRREDPARYGRMVMDDDGTLKKIVEYKDATPEQREITLCNGGFVCADGAALFGWLDQVGNDNAAKEFYLTDLPPIARRDNRTTHVVEIPEEEMAGANDRAEMAELERMMQDKLRAKHMANGVSLIDPSSVFFSFDTVIGADTVIEPHVFFGPGVTIGAGAHINAFSRIEGAAVGDEAEVGPFARLRQGAKLGRGAVIGNFVEVKNATLAPGAKAKHLAYLGDAEIGEKANIGAGTIFCNYDGFLKYKSTVGKGAFVGSNTTIISPVAIGDEAIVGGGSVISKDVPADALGVARAKQVNMDGHAAAFRARKKKEKESK